MESERFFDDTNLTARKRKELQMKALSAEIDAAEDSVKDYSVFLCSVSPAQTLVELQQLMGTLRYDTREFAAVKHLAASIRSRIDFSGNLDTRTKWLHIAAYADDVVLEAMRRRDETNLKLLVAGTGPSSSPPRAIAAASHATPTTPAERRQRMSSQPPTPPPSSAKKGPLLSPQNDVSAFQRSGTKRESPPQDDFVSVMGTPLFNTLREQVPPLSLDRSHQRATEEYAPQQQGLLGVDTGASRAQDEGRFATPTQLTTHALAQKEIRSVERLYEGKLDAAHRQWRSERSELIENLERLEKLLKEQHAVEKADMVETWNVERQTLLSHQDALRTELREWKDRSRTLEDSVDKLKQVVHVLGQRLETSEARSSSLQDQQRSLHETLSRAVAAAPSTGSHHQQRAFASSAALVSPDLSDRAAGSANTTRLPDPLPRQFPVGAERISPVAGGDCPFPIQSPSDCCPISYHAVVDVRDPGDENGDGATGSRFTRRLPSCSSYETVSPDRATSPQIGA